MSYRAPIGFHRITLADLGGSLNDPSTFLNGSPSDSGTAITIPLLGSKTVGSYTTIPDPNTAVWGSAPLYDAYGRPVTGDFAGAVCMRIRSAGTVPVIGDNVMFWVGFMNEAAPSGGTIKALLTALDFTNANGNPRVRSWVLNAGTVASHATGTATATIEGLSTIGARIGNNLVNGRVAVGIDSARATVSGSNCIAVASLTDTNTTQKYILIAAARTSSGDTDNIAPTMIFEYLPPVTAIQ